MWRILIVTLLLRSIAALELRLTVTHPGGSGGIRFVGRFPNAYTLFVLALSCNLGAAIVEHLRTETITTTVYAAVMIAWVLITNGLLAFPALFFVRFFKNHGLLSVKHRPQWYVIKGGSRSYIEPMIEPFKDRVHVNKGVSSVQRNQKGVTLIFNDGQSDRFDQVVFACHSDQALAMLDAPSADELLILGALPYSMNDVVLHTDERLLPSRRKAWAAWNYHIPGNADEAVGLTYNMNILQNFNNAPVTFCVTLNRTQDIDPTKIIDRFSYAHPVFTKAGIDAQDNYHSIGNRNRSHFCGAYWYNGFHEDGVNSALRVVKDFGVDPWH
jgi:predicted NAD/FAD-binding protein